MRPGPPPDTYALANRLAVAEAKLAAVERALRALFRRVNVNRPGAPEVVLDRLLLSLAELLAGIEQAQANPPNQVRAPYRPCQIGLSASAEEVAGGHELRVDITDGAGDRHVEEFLPRTGPEVDAELNRFLRPRRDGG